MKNHQDNTEPRITKTESVSLLGAIAHFMVKVLFAGVILAAITDHHVN